MILEDLVKRRFIGNVDLVEFWLLAANKLNTIEDFRRGIVEIVRNNDFVARFQERQSGEGSYVTGTAAVLH